jgi:hypothetical protein
MAQSSRDTITTRIALEGGQEILRQLGELGQQGERAFKQIQDAVNASNAPLAPVEAGVSRVVASFRGLSASLSPIRESFTDLRDKAARFSEAVAGVADRAIPHFREIAALALGASVAGFVELTKSSAEAAHAIGLAGLEFGISAKSFQEMQTAAAAAGGAIDNFARLFSRAATLVNNSASAQKDAVVGLAQLMVGQTAQSGVAIIGVAQQVQGKLVTLGQASTELIDRIGPHIVRSLADAGAVKSLDQVKNELRGLLGQTDATGLKARELARSFGAVEGKTLFEQLGTQAGEGSKALNQLGIDFLNAQNHARSLDEVIPAVAKAFETIGSDTQRAALAVQIFGRGGAALIPILHQLATGAGGAGAGFQALLFTKEQIHSSEEFIGKMNLLERAASLAKNQIFQVFQPVFLPLIEAVTSAILENAVAIKAWAAGIAHSAAPVVEDLITLVKNLGRTAEEQEPLTTGFGKNLVSTFAATRDVALGLGQAFLVLGAAVDLVLRPINALFGTELTGPVVLATVALLQFTGVFGLLGAAIALVDAAVSALVTGPLLALIAIVGPAGALLVGLIALGAFLLIWNDNWKNITNTAAAFWQLLVALDDFIGGPFTTVITAFIAFMKGDWSGAFDIVAEAVQRLISWLGSLIDKAIEAARAFSAGIFGAGGGSAPVVPGFAAGGLVPGSGFGDKIRALLEPGEFVIRRAAVNVIGRDVLARLNGGLNLMPQRTRFATGGLVMAGAGGGSMAPVHLHLNGRAFPVMADRDVRDALVREARRSAIVSAGPKPSWKS